MVWAAPEVSGDAALRTLTSVGARIERAGDDGRVRLIGAQAGRPIGSDAVAGAAARLADPAWSYVERFGPVFGVRDPAGELTVKRMRTDAGGRTIARYQQHYRNVPILGAELVTTLDAEGRMMAMSGEVAPQLQLQVEPQLPAATARSIAGQATAKWYGVDVRDLRITGPELSIYVPQLFKPSAGQANLVWRVEVASIELRPIRELVLVNAATGAIALHFNQVHQARDRQTYSAGGTASLPGSLVCDEGAPDCTGGIDADADAAHRYASDTYDFYSSRHGRDGINDGGATIISTVAWNDGFSCPNAFWNGTQIVYCDTLPLADDVVAHELTHGVTQNESGLYYYYQSGAINESLSDIWGEFVDLTNTGGTDDPSVRWQMGEDAVALGGAIRDMADPTAFGDPDRMTSPNYYTGALDGGGVHTNSGVNNKAAFLMVDGDTFNGITVAGIGIDKAARIYYEAQTNLLTSGSDYADLYAALYQGCLNLVGTAGIVSADCEEVRKATGAVEMNEQPIADFNPDAQLCPGERTAVTLWSDDMESGTANWSFTPLSGSNAWGQSSGFAASGTDMLWGNSNFTSSDAVAALASDVALPAGRELFLHFKHSFGFEASDSDGERQYWDGGMLEYSTTQGVSWQDAGPLIDDGQGYNGTISTLADNANAGRDAFADESHGYVSTRVVLGALAGQTLRMRWRSSTDFVAAGPFGWVVDDVHIYWCNRNPQANAGPDGFVTAGTVASLDGSASSDPDAGDPLSYAWTQTGGTSVTLSDANTATPGFTVPPTAGEMLNFRLDVTDAQGGTSSDAVTVTVNRAPVAAAGADQQVDGGASVSLSGVASTDPDGDVLGYLWEQTSGQGVTLSGAGTVTSTFTAPNVNGELVFRLTVDDGKGATTTDTVRVVVGVAAGDGGGGGGLSLELLGLALMMRLLRCARSRKPSGSCTT